MNVLITGCAGQVGQAITAHLVKSGYAVRGLDRVESFAGEIDYRSCDLHDADALAPHIEGMDAVLHLAAIPAPGRAPNADIFQINAAADQLSNQPARLFHHVAESHFRGKSWQPCNWKSSLRRNRSSATT